MLTTYIIGSLALIVKPRPDLTCTIAKNAKAGFPADSLFTIGPSRILQ